MDLHTGKIPPQAVELEEYILGAIIIEGNVIKQVAELLAPEIFYKEVHQLIYSAITSLYNNNIPVDLLTVTNELKKRGELERCGGAYAITMLCNKVASASNIEYWCRIIIQKWMQREVIRLSGECNERAFDDTIDIFETINYLNLQIKSIEDKYFEGSETPDELLKQSVKEVYKRVDNFNKGINNSIPTPVNDINKKIVGAEKGEVIILAARPSMGKTQFMLKWAEVATVKNKPLIFSLEMSALELINRRICSDAGIDSVQFRRGNLSIDELKNIEIASERIKSKPILIERGYSLPIIKSKTRQNYIRNGVDIVFIDYLQLIERPGRNDNSEIEKISRELKLLAQELNIAIVLLSQLNRECEKTSNKIPALHHLRDSGAIEQDADLVMFLYRPFVYGIRDFEYFGSKYVAMDGSDIFAIIPKFRNGETCHIHFKATERMAAFKDKDEFDGQHLSYLNNKDVF